MSSKRLFLWQGQDANGQQKQGELTADNRRQAQYLLINQGCYPTKISQGIRMGRKNWKAVERVRIMRQLATMLQAGLPLAIALRLLSQQHNQPAWRYVLSHIQQLVAQGSALSQALSQYPEAFPSLYKEIITTGELTGKLDLCCLQLAAQQEHLLHIQTKVRKALRYPLFILVIAAIVTLMMLMLVLPEFAEIYKSFDAPLPWFTQFIIHLSHLLLKSGHYLLMFSISVVWFYLKKLRPQRHWLQREQKCMMNFPLFHKLMTSSCLSRAFRTLAMTQSTGISLLDGLNAASNAVGNLFYQQALNDIKQLVSEGSSLHLAIKQQPLFPPFSQQLIFVGEESGALESMLEKLAKTYEQQTEEYADQLSQSLEPVMMLIVGGIVGVLIIAMYLPIFQLGSVIS